MHGVGEHVRHPHTAGVARRVHDECLAADPDRLVHARELFGDRGVDDQEIGQVGPVRLPLRIVVGGLGHREPGHLERFRQVDRAVLDDKPQQRHRVVGQVERPQPGVGRQPGERLARDLHGLAQIRDLPGDPMALDERKREVGLEMDALHVGVRQLVEHGPTQPHGLASVRRVTHRGDPVGEAADEQILRLRPEAGNPRRDDRAAREPHRAIQVDQFAEPGKTQSVYVPGRDEHAGGVRVFAVDSHHRGGGVPRRLLQICHATGGLVPLAQCVAQVRPVERPVGAAGRDQVGRHARHRHRLVQRATPVDVANPPHGHVNEAGQRAGQPRIVARRRGDDLPQKLVGPLQVCRVAPLAVTVEQCDGVADRIVGFGGAGHPSSTFRRAPPVKAWLAQSRRSRRGRGRTGHRRRRLPDR